MYINIKWHNRIKIKNLKMIWHPNPICMINSQKQELELELERERTKCRTDLNVTDMTYKFTPHRFRPILTKFCECVCVCWTKVEQLNWINYGTLIYSDIDFLCVCIPWGYNAPMKWYFGIHVSATSIFISQKIYIIQTKIRYYVVYPVGKIYFTYTIVGHTIASTGRLKSNGDGYMIPYTTYLYLKGIMYFQSLVKKSLILRRHKKYGFYNDY